MCSWGWCGVGLGGTTGKGTQYVSWIHEVDFIRAIELLIADDRFTGPVNLAAPNPLPNREFMRALREAWGIGFRAAGGGVDGGDWDVGDADGVGAGAEEPEGGSGAAAGGWV